MAKDLHYLKRILQLWKYTPARIGLIAEIHKLETIFEEKIKHRLKGTEDDINIYIEVMESIDLGGKKVN